MDWTHLHLALNHIPVVGVPFLLTLLVWSWARQETRALRFSLLLFVVLAAAAIAIKFTGDFAAEKLATAPGFDRALIDRHEQTADQASTGVFLMGLAALFALVRSRHGRPTPRNALSALVLIAVTTLLLLARTANSGGHIRHPEIRPQVQG